MLLHAVFDKQIDRHIYIDSLIQQIEPGWTPGLFYYMQYIEPDWTPGLCYYMQYIQPDWTPGSWYLFFAVGGAWLDSWLVHHNQGDNQKTGQ